MDVISAEVKNESLVEGVTESCRLIDTIIAFIDVSCFSIACILMASATSFSDASSGSVRIGILVAVYSILPLQLRRGA